MENSKVSREKAKEWYDSIFLGCGGETIPVRDGRSAESETVSFEYTGEISAGDINAFCKENDIEKNAFFTAAFGMALQTYTVSEQAVFSTLYHEKSDTGSGKIFPVLFAPEQQKQVKETILDCQKYLLSATENDMFGYDEIKEAYGIASDILFSFNGEGTGSGIAENADGNDTDEADLRMTSKFRVDVRISDDRILYMAGIDRSWFSQYTINGFVRLLDKIVSEFVKKETIGEIEFVSKEDKNAILTLNDTAVKVKERPAYRLLQDSAKKNPDKAALIAIDRTLTYRELNEEANAVAHALIEAGAKAGVCEAGTSDMGLKPDTIVAVLADRNSYAYVMREGVLKTGGAFMPVDPEYPEERIRYIMDDSGSKLLVTTGEIIERRKEFIETLESEGVVIINAEVEAENNDRTDLNVSVPYEALAYVIYTSGSTGKPKGVMVTNKNLVNFCDISEKNAEAYVFTKWGGVSIAFAAFTFDVSILEEFIPLSVGMTVVLATMEQIMDAYEMCELIVKNHVCVIACTPSYIMNMIEIEAFAPAVRELKFIDVGAEAFPPVLYDKLKAINPDLYIANTYGPTECTVTCTFKEVLDSKDVTIGRPLANVTIATVDRNCHLQPLGAMGELVIMGEGVSRGYIGREDLNKRNFIHLLDLPAYRSGDLVRIREDGEIDFHGRIDNQVKLRGLRVELGEVESVIGTYPSIRATVVVVIHGETDYLAAYFTADEKVDISALCEHVSKYLTAYMVPQAFMQLDQMPMTANGKVDKRALPAIEIVAEEIIPAENEVQGKILDMVREVIGTDGIGITTDLVISGLSSIGCIRLCSMLAESFDVFVKVAEIFESRNVKGIEALIGSKAGEETVSYELRESYPITKTQMGIYIDSELYEGTTIYNLPYIYKLDDRVDIMKLREALQKTFLSHPYLFMTLRNEDGEIRAVRNKPVSIDIDISDTLPETSQLVRPFDLTSGERLFRVQLFDTDTGKYLFIDTHHIVSDGSSLTIFFKDVDRAYNGESIPTEEYTGYEAALDEEYALTTDRPKAAKAWYDSIFTGCGGETMPVKDGKPTKEGIALLRFSGKTSAESIRRFCSEKGITLNAFFTTAFGMALKAYTASEQAVFSTIYNGRNDPRIDRSISMFVKTFPVMFETGEEDTVIETIQSCQSFLLSAMANDIYSFTEISSAYDIKADILFAYQGELYEAEETTLCGYPVTFDDLALSQSMAKISMDIMLDEDKVVFINAYEPSAYSEYTVNGLARLLDNIAGEFLVKEKIGDISLVSKEDEDDILALYDTKAEVKERPVYRILQDSSQKYPDRTAVIAVDRTLTYRELNEGANAVGHVLIETGSEHGVTDKTTSKEGLAKDTIVAVLADRDSYAYIMREGVLKSGGAFMPIDPEYPEERIRFIMEDSGAKLIITTGRIIDRRRALFEKLQAEGMVVINAEEAVNKGKKTDLDIEVPGEALAYIIYTSGSTGKPKGVMIANRNVINITEPNDKNHEVLCFTQWGSVSIAMAAFTFDVSVLEELVPIAAGMTIVLATSEQIMDAPRMCELIVGNNVDTITCTPSYIMNMIEIKDFEPAVKRLKSIDVGSEAFPPVLYEKLKAINPDLYIVNTYGPTECTVTSTLKEVVDSGDVTIGGPLANVTLATVDRNGHLQPLGAMGELLIMGAGVGRGYIGRDDLNKRNFIHMLGQPAYRSGDLVRIREDGEIDFHGRIDNQVKLRGLRVELGEVENVIGTYPSVRSVVVVVIHGETDYLAAYFTADEKVEISALREHISGYLTAYMVPQAFMQLDQMPMTANGKVDKKALPDIDFSEEEIVPAENEVQEKIINIVLEVIGSGKIGITTDLFMSGLSSIGCIRLCSLLSDSFDISVKVAEIFECRTVKSIEALIGTKTGEEAVSYELRESYPLTQTQMGIYIDSELYTGTTIYNIPYLYKLDDRVDMNRLHDALKKTLNAHPYLFMTLREENGEIRAIRPLQTDFDIKISNTLPSVGDLVKPFYLNSGEPLFRTELFDTKDGKYLFVDMHHIVSDGGSLTIFFEDMNAAYRGEDIKPEEFTGYEAALDEEYALKTDRPKAAKAWYDSIFTGCGGETLPAKDGKPTDSRIENIEHTGKNSADKIRVYCDENGLSLNAFFTTAFGLALQSYTSSEQAIFSTIYNGRNDSRMARSISMFVKTLPVRVKADEKATIKKTILDCQNYLLSAMANDIYSFANIRNAYGIGADILFAYQGETKETEEDELCGYPVTSQDLSLSQAKSLIGIDISLNEDNVQYDCEYLPSAYSRDTVDGLISLMDRIVGEFITKKNVSEIEPIMTGIRNTHGRIDTQVKQRGIGKTLSQMDHSSEDIVKPENAIHEKILEIAKKIIGNSRIGIDMDLFAAGLSSLSCIRMIADLKGGFGANINIADLFEARTVRRIGELIEVRKAEKEYEIRGEYPLSMTQMGIFVESVRYAGTTVYNIPYLYGLDKNIDIDRLKNAIVQAVNAHPYICMMIHESEDGNILAVRSENPCVEIPVSKDRPVLDELVQPFDLTAGEPLYRIKLFDLPDSKYLFVDFHHIIMDGESFDIFLDDVNSAYMGRTLKAEHFSGFEYALYEDEKRRSKSYDEARDFYDSIFKGCEPCTLPKAESSAKEGHISVGELTGEMDAEDVRKFCAEHRISENAFFTVAFGLALSSYTASEEAVFTTIYNGRNDPRLSDSVGMYVKTLPVLVRAEEDDKTGDVLSKCNEYLIGAMSHDIYGFNEISNRYGIKSDAIFAYQGDTKEDKELIIGGYKVEETEEVQLSQAKASIDMNVMLNGDRIEYEYEYDPSLYGSYTMDGLVRMMDRIVSELLVKENIRDITLISGEDERKILSLHDTSSKVKERPAYRLLQDSAVLYPERTALIASDRTLTYKELNEEANAVGHTLIASFASAASHAPGVSDKGLIPDTLVAVMADRDSYSYVMRKGVLKSGGAFLPIDPEYPDERIRFILSDSGTKFLLTTGRVIERRREFFDALASEGIVIVDAERAVADKDCSREDLNVDVPYEALAYVIYTSGSTGKPKGVMLTNKNLVNFVDANEKNHEILGYTEYGSVSLAIAALTFDFSIMEEFVPIANGMTVVIATQDQILNPDKLTDLMVKNKVDVMSCTPGYLANLISIDSFMPALKGLKSVDFGAEAFPPALFDKLKALNPGLYIMNGYGPTEATISCTMDVINSADDITIGIPNANVHVATVDRSGRLQPLGAIGEMIIMGDGVGRGYIGRDDLNRKSFIRMLDMPAYRSGDLVRIREDGDIEFHGRIDDQVKLRGLRVELGEVESVIATYPGVRSSVVMVVHGETDYLGAYFTADDQVDIMSLKDHISKYLTAYMVPQAFMQLEQMPMTANGKIDKKALPEIKMAVNSSEKSKPENELQKLLCELFEKALGMETGIDDDFFEMGGTSLTAAKVLMGAKVKNIPIEYQDIFDAKTVRKLEFILSRRMNGETKEVPVKHEIVRNEDPKIEKVLEHNSFDYVSGISENDIGNVLLAGATGFLGIHVLKELIDHSSCKITCLVHGRRTFKVDISPESRLRLQLFYYFDDNYEELFGQRIFVEECSISDRDGMAGLKDADFDTVINCAASVKHFADFDFLKQVNVDGVENLIDLCLKKNARLIHLSTVSVSGEAVDDSAAEKELTENRLNIGQDVTSNAYVHTKYLAEEKVLRAVAEQGLDAKIMRLGNLMSRQEDGEFQINFHTNNFMNTLRAYAALGCCPYSEMYEQTDFSPIDETARFVLKLAGTAPIFTVFHVYNSHVVDMADVLAAMDSCGVHIETVSDEIFAEKLRECLKDDSINSMLSPLVNYDLTDDSIRSDIPGNNRFTVQALFMLGARWSITDMDYLKKMIIMLKTLGFFDVRRKRQDR